MECSRLHEQHVAFVVCIDDGVSPNDVNLLNLMNEITHFNKNRVDLYHRMPSACVSRDAEPTANEKQREE